MAKADLAAVAVAAAFFIGIAEVTHQRSAHWVTPVTQWVAVLGETLHTNRIGYVAIGAGSCRRWGRPRRWHGVLWGPLRPRRTR